MMSYLAKTSSFLLVKIILILTFIFLIPRLDSSIAQSWEPFAAGGSGWEVLYSGSASTFRFNGLERLSYDPGNGQWSQMGDFNGGIWSNLGSVGQPSTFIGDGTDHSIGAGWSIRYNASNYMKQDSSWLAYSGSYRLAYNYTEGQWWQKGVDWSKLGSSGISSTFIGDGTDHSIGAGWSFRYNASNYMKQDSSWLSLNGSYRLAYNYTEGQWWQKGVDWSKLGSSGISSTFIGDGTDHSIGAGWSFRYNASNYMKQDSSWLALNGSYRLAYNYTEGQWWQKGVDWSKLGSSGISSTFIGDGTDHSIGAGWSYQYNASNDCAYWKDGAAFRFSYGYANGLWSDYYSSSWRTLSQSGISSSFLGDGAYHRVWSDGASYRYLASSDLGYWSSTGVINNDDFRVNYATSQWYRYYDGSTVYDNVEYKGNRQYLLTDYLYWTSSGVKSATYTGSSYGTDVQNTLWYDATNSAFANWYIFTPGADLKWSGESLDVVVMNNNIDSLWMRSWEQYTREDVISIEYDLEGGVSLSTVLTGLGYLTGVYGKTIDDLNVVCHGNYTGFYFGNWISTYNYTSYSSQWTQLNNLMTNGGQIQLSHCETGDAASMLNDIAARTNTRIFANINSGWTTMYYLNYNYGSDNPNVWNYNYKNVFWGAVARPFGSTDYTRPKVNFVDYDFEYQSDGSGNRGYKMLYSFYNPGYSQTDMVYWWNNGNGRP